MFTEGTPLLHANATSLYDVNMRQLGILSSEISDELNSWQ